MTTDTITHWHGCYDDSWKGTITDEAFSHPAKFSKGLIERIADHLALPRGSIVVDPFGGVGLGGIVFASRGVQWVGCELEEKFVKLAQQNFELHRRTWEGFGDPLPVIVQGDSRRLREHIRSALGVKALPGLPVLANQADCVVSSPPYEGSLNNGQLSEKDVEIITHNHLKKHGNKGDLKKQMANRLRMVGHSMGSSPENIGNQTGDTFWAAARDIVAECYAILKPGGLAVWVTKDFVRKGARVPFSDDWERLCVSCGFEPVERIHAQLVKRESHPSLFGGEEITTKERKSFFRRLAESKGSPAIDHEDVIVATSSGGRCCCGTMNARECAESEK